MKLLHRILIIGVFVNDLILLGSIRVDARFHFHKNAEINYQPKNSPDSDSPAVSPPYAPSPSAEDENVGSTESCVFDVTAYGAVGDGETDDTSAFQNAWKAACVVENGVVLAPANYSFTITSTIFSGPCQPGLVFQVHDLKNIRL